MPDIFTSLREQVLRDIGIDPADLKLRKSGIGNNVIIEGGGSRGDYPEDEGDTPDTPVDNLTEGIDYFADPVAEEDFGSSVDRFDVLDTFLTYVVSSVVWTLKVYPVATDPDSPTFTVGIRKSGNRPIQLGKNLFTYGGGTYNFSTYLSTKYPGGIPSAVTVLMVLKADGTITIVDTPTVVADKTQWPKDGIPLTLVNLYPGQAGITFDDMEDVRPIIRWGYGNEFRTQKWNLFQIQLSYDFPLGITPLIGSDGTYNDNVIIHRNGIKLTEGATNDYTIQKYSGRTQYYVSINFIPESNEIMDAWYVVA